MVALRWSEKESQEEGGGGGSTKTAHLFSLCGGGGRRGELKKVGGMKEDVAEVNLDLSLFISLFMARLAFCLVGEGGRKKMFSYLPECCVPQVEMWVFFCEQNSIFFNAGGRGRDRWRISSYIEEREEDSGKFVVSPLRTC